MSPTRTRTAASRRSNCAIACTLDLVGDKWTLLVVRDLLHGKSTFTELADSPEGIRPICWPIGFSACRTPASSRARSIRTGRPSYSYSLSEKGTALGEVLLAYVRWGRKHIPGTRSL